MRPQCTVPGCTSPAGRLPDSVAFLGTALCDEHVQHLLRVRIVATETFADESFADLAVLREAQSLMHSSEATPALVVLKGGR